MELQRFKLLLRKSGHFITQPRLRLFASLQKHNAVSISELITHLSRHDQATVYRNIKLFENLGIINRLRLGWNSKLELSDTFEHHHHHLSCVKCGKVTVLSEDATIEKHIASLVRCKSFKAMDHQLEIRGLCHSCQNK